MFHVEAAEAVHYAEDAAQLLRASWQPPCVHYTSSYLDWQFTYPSDRSTLAAAAREGNRLVGFAAVIPRRVRVMGTVRTVYHLSFVCVSPDYRKHGVGVELYRNLLGQVASTGIPFVAYTMNDSPGLKTLLSGSEVAGFAVKSLGKYGGYGYLHRPNVVPPTIPERSVAAATDADEAELRELLASADDGRTLAVEADSETIRHWKRDPRRFANLLIRREGRLVGTAMLVRGRISTNQGISPVTTVEHLVLRDHDSQAFAALVRAAGAVWNESGRPEFVSLPNLRDVPDEIIRAAGVRLTPTHFLGHLGIGPDCDLGPMADVSTTNMAVN